MAASMRDAVALLEQAVHLDPNFTLAYCVSTEAHDTLYHLFDPSPERRALADAAINNALRIQPDLPEVRLAYAHYLYLIFQDYEQARVQLAIARAGLPNSAEQSFLPAGWIVGRVTSKKLSKTSKKRSSSIPAIHSRWQSCLRLPRNAKALSQLAAVDAPLNNKETAISEGKTAVEMTPIFKDAVDGPFVLANLAIVYAWAGELDLAFATLEPLKRTPSFIGYGDFKCDSLWTPLRKDSRFDPLLAELAPRD